MTNPPEHDPLRALDDVEPAGSWDDVVAHAERLPESMAPDPGARSRRPLLVAAAVMVALAVAGGVAWAARDSDHHRSTVNLTSKGDGRVDPPTAIWGHQWEVVSIVRDGAEQPVIPAPRAPLRLNARDQGALTFNGCNGAGGAAHLESSTVVADGDWAHTDMACFSGGDQNDTTLMDQETWLDGFLRAGPTVVVDDDHLTLATASARIELVDTMSFDPATAMVGRTWRVTRFVLKGEVQPTHLADVDDTIEFAFDESMADEHPPVHGGNLHFLAGCHPLTVAASISFPLGEQAPDPDVAQLGMLDAPRFPDGGTGDACVGGPPAGQLEVLFKDPPRIQVLGDRLYLRSGSSWIEAVEVPDPAGTTTTTGPTDPNLTTRTEATPTESTTTTSAPTTTTTTAPKPPNHPERLFGHDWKVVDASDGWLTSQYVGAVLHAHDGQVTVDGCNGAGGAMRLDGDHLVKEGEWIHTRKGCQTEPGKPDLMAQDRFFEGLLERGLSVEYREGATQATLSQGLLAYIVLEPVN